VENHVEIASGRLGALSRKAFLHDVTIQSPVGRTEEKFLSPIVDFGDKWCESAGLRQPARVKLLARAGEPNKPQLAKHYNLQQTLF
jgi:hypothetical protein